MKKILFFIITVAIGLALYVSSQKEDEPELTLDNDSLRHTLNGRVIGFRQGNSHAWRRIPYAAPPVGDLRWRAPRVAANWVETRESIEASPACPQLGGPLGGADSALDDQVIGQEDCLYLDVWAPAMASDKLPDYGKRLPVMVWIHGGGNSVGHGSGYTGARLSGEHGVIVVSINYRLGVLGWFSHPSLRQGNSNPLDNSANFGTMDMIAALQWVQENIAGFGGDPDRVTIFGESAGGKNVLALLASPMAEGMFHRAISQSGDATGTSVEVAERAYTEQYDGHKLSSESLIARWKGETKRGKAADAELGAMASWLRSLSTETMIAGLKDGAIAGMYRAPQQILDGIVLPKQPIIKTLADRNLGSDVPVILGTNRDESKLFMIRNEDFVDTTLGLFVRAKDPERYQRIARYSSDVWKFKGADEPARALVASGQKDVFNYRFDWDEASDSVFADLPFLLGAAHGMEIPFVFGDLTFPLPGIFTDSNLADARKLSEAIMSYWVYFAKTGQPSSGHRGQLKYWPSWAEKEAFMVLDTKVDGGLRVRDKTFTAEKLQQELLSAPPFAEPLDACALYARAFYRTPWWREQQYQTLNAGQCRTHSPGKFF